MGQVWNVCRTFCASFFPSESSWAWYAARKSWMACQATNASSWAGLVVARRLLTSMAGYAADMFAASDALAGLASSGFILGAVASRLLTGKFLDFIGRRGLVLISMDGYIFIGLAYLPVASLSLLIALRLRSCFGAGTTALVASV